MLEGPLWQSQRSLVRDACHRPCLSGARRHRSERHVFLRFVSLLAPDLQSWGAEAPLGEKQATLKPTCAQRLMSQAATRRLSAGPMSGQTRSRCSAGSSPSGCPPGLLVWLTIGLRPAGHRDEAWLKKGLPCS